MAEKVLIIQGHPDEDGFNNSISLKYREGAELSGAQVKEIKIREFKFNPVLYSGYRGTEQLEKDIITAQELIKWADHLVIIYPNWWGTYPALFKGFIDKVFWPGFAFRFREKSLGVDKLLSGRSARVIVTMDTPWWIYNFLQGRPGHRAMKKAILEFCGIHPVKFLTMTPVRNAPSEKLNKWLKTAYSLGLRRK
jgi:putative NADPH-quinone reductase